MKSIKLALMAGAAIAVSAAAAQADDLDALKAQIEALNARVAAMEAAPAVPAGYQLLAISKGDLQQTPGVEMSQREKAAYGNKSHIISVMPTADAPAGAVISWSGYTRAAVVYSNSDVKVRRQDYDWNFNTGDWDVSTLHRYDTETDDWDVAARGQIRVQASTDTAVGEVGVNIVARANFNGNGERDADFGTAWGYWAMTPELTFGGGYNDSLGQINFGYDGACSCYYTDNADVGFDPGDTTQMRLTYASGPLSVAIALEDGSFDAANANLSNTNLDDLDATDADRLGVSGEIKYSGDTFSGEIAGVWRDVNEDDYQQFWRGGGAADARWQIGAGLGFGLGDSVSFSVAAAMGEGPGTTYSDANGPRWIDESYNVDQTWWGVSGLARVNLTDEVSAELGAGYKHREADDFNYGWDEEFRNHEYETWAVLGGLYYTPVDQLTIGVEAEWFTTDESFTVQDVSGGNRDRDDFQIESDNFSVDLVSVWRF